MGLITTPPLAYRPPKIEQSRIMASGDKVGNNLIRYPFLRWWDVNSFSPSFP